MNKFDERYDIRLAKYEDIESIMKFINDNWKMNHIMAVDRDFFEYEFVVEKDVNFVLAISKDTNEIEGLMGFLYASNPESIQPKDIWGSIWKVKDGNAPFLGIEIAKRLEHLTECRMELGVGLNPKTAVPIRRKIFKDEINRLEHYYFLNNNIGEFKVAEIFQKKNNEYLSNSNIEVKEFLDISCLKNKFNEKILLNRVPYKDLWYINKRFFNHPYYKYKIFAIKFNEDKLYQSLLIVREVNVYESSVLRIVDYYGNRELFQYLGVFLNELMIENDYEYIDFYTLGFEKEFILNAGFNLRDKDDNNIIPNYFEPFVKQNIEIWVNYPKWVKNISFYKADADQDRPNEIFKYRTIGDNK